RRSTPGCHNPGIRKELLVLVGTFLAATAIALLAGAKNLGTALTFGQIAFAAALVAVLLRPPWRRPASAGREGPPPPPPPKRRRTRP
ncbi:MAG TPA: hypothetical protein VE780_13310, partial [Thermoleophilaceae bacterium]|nr:hypothetical protein [Thermoleophilaceae bacterium]